VSRIQASAVGREAAQTVAVDECRAMCERLQKRTADLSLELSRMDSTVATVLDVELVRVEEGLESRMLEFGKRQGELEGMIKASLEVAQERFRDMSGALQDQAKMSGMGGGGQGGGAVPTRLELASGWIIHPLTVPFHRSCKETNKSIACIRGFIHSTSV
jgi:hypothetical protein